MDDDLRSQIRQLEIRVGELEARSAIQDLRFRYHVAVNEKDLDSIGPLFSQDAEVHFEGIGSARGRAEIESLYREVVGQSPFIKQFIHNHLITVVDDETATGLSYLDARTVREGESILVAARFDDDYVREQNAWKFRSLRLELFFAVPIAEGWAGPDRIRLE